MKGQASFESLMLLLVIITATIYISTLFLENNNTTTAYSLIRSELLLQSNSTENLIIKKIELKFEEQPTFYITTIPSTYTNSDFNLDKIYFTLNKETNIQNPIIQIN